MMKCNLSTFRCFPFKDNHWTNNATTKVELNCFMPNGIFIPITADKTTTFRIFKEDLWEESAKYPLYDTLHDISCYFIVFVNREAHVENLINENRRICDVKPFGAVLKLMRKGKYHEIYNAFDFQIGQVIGKDLYEFDELKSAEVNNFRSRMSYLCEHAAYSRSTNSWREILRYQFPSRFALTDYKRQVFSKHSPLPQRIRNQCFVVVVKFEDANSSSSSSSNSPLALLQSKVPSRVPSKSEYMQMMRKGLSANTGLKCFELNPALKVAHKIKGVVKYNGIGLTTFTFNVSLNTSPNMLLKMVINKRATTLRKTNESVYKFVLKVCGREEYIYGYRQLLEYVYVYECLSRNKTPTFFVVPVDELATKLSSMNYYIPRTLPVDDRLPLVSRKRGKYIDSFIVDKRFKFKVSFISNFNIQLESIEIAMKVGLFHGGKLLCQPTYTREILSNDGNYIYNNESLKMDILIGDLPRMARLCFSVFEICRSAKTIRSKKLKGIDNEEYFLTPLGWVNTTVFDFKGHLRTGSLTLHMWPYPDNLPADDLLQPLNTVVCNPESKGTMSLTLTFYDYYPNTTITYPSIAAIQQFAEHYGRLDIVPELTDSNFANQLLNRVRILNDRVLRNELHEQDRKHLWRLRYHIKFQYPSLLPKILHCVDWCNRFEALEAIALIQSWPLVSADTALQLLDFAYADGAVRSYAVKCLYPIKDQQLELYLLQLIQALKHECYVQSDLIDFLLQRSVQSQFIGHYFFWHLRSEMHVKSVSDRFGLFLEAYCRGSPKHVEVLDRQLSVLKQLQKITSMFSRKRVNRDKLRNYLHKKFLESQCFESLRNIYNPLDPQCKWASIRVKKCRVMDSKTRPLWLVFENSDPFGEDIHIIFKNGDDLRQDMLTLQMIRIMDNIWKSHGYDLRMSPYRCISTDNRVGMIEVVLNAETIANIQKEKGIFCATAAFRKGSILEWLSEHNNTQSSLNKAIEEFTYSCAGYCVATFVLGIADRHSDNIMVKHTGQLFHIDFGHILGHYKEKFGFRRERVPFVITHDFVHVINKGQAKTDGEEFKSFQDLCKNAFLILREHGTVILSLFSMMISTGLPELSCESDLNYLRESLVLQLSPKEAENYFLAKFDEALSNSWKTSLNWASHNVSKNNRN